MTEGGTGPDRGPISKMAVASAALGIASLGLLALTGIPAMILGYRALYRINADGRLRGKGWAVVGMVLGLAGTVFAVGWLVGVKVNDVWEKSRRASCIDNLRRIGKAVHSYHDANQGVFPRAVVPHDELDPEKRLSWLAAILPYLEADRRDGTRWKDKWARLNPDLGWQAPENEPVVREHVGIYLCPYHPRVRKREKPPISCYVGMTGVGEDSATLPVEHTRAGFFGYRREVRKSDLRPGESYVLIVGETGEGNDFWAAGGPATVRGIPTDSDSLIGQGAEFGGLHPEGMNTLWADASVRFHTNETPPALLREVVQINRPLFPEERP